MATRNEPKRRWVLVADDRRARIFVDRSGRLELLEAFEHCEARDSRLEVMWATFGNVGQSSKTLTTPHARRAVEQEGFARQLAARLERGVTDRAYNSLVITAPASFLSCLKSALSIDVEGRVEAYMSRDLSKSSERDVKAHVSQELGPQGSPWLE